MRRAALLLCAWLGACGGGDAASDNTFPDHPLVTVDSRDGKLQLAAYTAPEQPPSRGVISTKLVITAQGKPVDGLSMTVEPEMPSMGHGTAMVPKVAAQGHGTYLVTDVDLFMAGRWDLRIAITGEVTDAAVVPVDVR